jgi:hypothetical protein
MGVVRLTGYASQVRCLLAVLVALVACADHDIDGLVSVRDKVCACKTASCAEQEMTHVPSGPIKPTRHAQELARAIQDCLAKRQAAERPTTDPDAEGAADTPEAPEPAQPPPSQGAAASTKR